MSLGGFIVTLLDQPEREANIVTGLYLLSSTPELRGRRLHGRMIRLDSFLEDGSIKDSK